MPSSLIKSINGENIDTLPVWCMRQAGRYLPEYLEIRKKHSFNQISENPNLTKEVTLQPIKRFQQLDAAIIFADIMTPSRSLGFDFEFEPGPILKNPIKSPDDIEKCKDIDIEESVPYIFQALKMIRNELDNTYHKKQKALLGFAASPWTLSCYLIEQGIYKQHIGTLIFARKYPEQFEILSEKITNLTIKYLRKKIESGADAVQIFDTWGTLLSPSEYYQYSGKWISKIINELKKENHKVILYMPGGNQHLESAIRLKPDVISVDWRIKLEEIEKKVPPNIAIQGNLDPTLLFSDNKKIFAETIELYNSVKRRTKIIANLGHGMLPKTPLSAVNTYLDAVKEAWKK